MKKIIIFSLIFINFWSSFSQKNNIYIIIDSESNIDIVESKNNTLTIDIYRFNLNKEYLNYTFSLDKNNNVKKTFTVLNKESKYLKFIYKNNNDNNKPILFRKDKLINSITFNEMLNANNFKNLKKIINSYKCIYIIDKNLSIDNYYLAKKVSLDEVTKL